MQTQIRLLLEDQTRSSLNWVFPVCCSDQHFVNSSPENQYLVEKLKEKNVRNFGPDRDFGCFYLY